MPPTGVATAESEPAVVLLGTREPEIVELAAELGAEWHDVPLFTRGGAEWSFAADLDAWRAALANGDRWKAVAVAPWIPPSAPCAVVGVDLDTWIDRVEAPLAIWAGALGAGVARCADGGVVVAVVERPSPLDAAGRGAESSVADGVEALVRSLARAQGRRGVRVVAVTTPLRIGPEVLVDPAPSLADYPGAMAREVAGAVRLMLSPDAAGLTGTALHADCGRSWR